MGTGNEIPFQLDCSCDPYFMAINMNNQEFHFKTFFSNISRRVVKLLNDGILKIVYGLLFFFFVIQEHFLSVGLGKK